MPSRKSLPYIALIIGISALSMTGIFVRWAQAPGTVTAAYRMSISALAFLPFFLKKETARKAQERGLADPGHFGRDFCRRRSRVFEYRNRIDPDCQYHPFE